MADDIFGAQWLNDRPSVPQTQLANAFGRDRPNHFASASNVTELMYRVVAAGVICGVQHRDADAAVAIADAAIDRLIELAWARQNYVITTDTTTRT
jgi:hypothetical protein